MALQSRHKWGAQKNRRVQLSSGTNCETMFILYKTPTAHACAFFVWVQCWQGIKKIAEKSETFFYVVKKKKGTISGANSNKEQWGQMLPHAFLYLLVHIIGQYMGSGITGTVPGRGAYHRVLTLSNNEDSRLSISDFRHPRSWRCYFLHRNEFRTI